MKIAVDPSGAGGLPAMTGKRDGARAAFAGTMERVQADDRRDDERREEDRRAREALSGNLPAAAVAIELGSRPAAIADRGERREAIAEIGARGKEAPGTEAGPKADADARTESATDARTESATDARTETETETKTGTGTKTATETASETDTDTDAATDPATASDPATETAAATDTSPDAGRRASGAATATAAATDPAAVSVAATVSAAASVSASEAASEAASETEGGDLAVELTGRGPSTRRSRGSLGTEGGEIVPVPFARATEGGEIVPVPFARATPEAESRAYADAPPEAAPATPADIETDSGTPQIAHARIVLGEHDERVVVSVALRHGTVDVNIRAAAPELDAAAARSLDDLDQALRRHGLSLGNHAAGDSSSSSSSSRHPAATPAPRGRYGHASAADEPLALAPIPTDPRLRALA